MLVELRTYNFHPGKLEEFLKVYSSGPLALQRSTLGNMIGYFVTESGMLNSVMHMWGYADFDDRNRRRAKLAANCEWQAFLARIQPLLQSQRSQMLRPTDFSPIQ